MSRWLPLMLVAVVPAFCWAPAASLVRAEEAAKTAVDKEKKPATKFLRVLRDDKDEPKSLDTAIVSYKPASGKGELVVDLIGAVHVGEKSYYETLNKEFEKYDVLLYELVAPTGTRVPKGGKPADNPVAMLQLMTQDMLKLESQLDLIDYTKENFVHADMSPAEMAEAMKNRGDTGFTVMLSVTADLMRQANLEAQRKKERGEEESLQETFALLFDANRGEKMKRTMAEQFEQMDMDGGLGPTLGRMILTDRNEAAMKVFQKEVVKGHKRIGIFYGAAHMADFEKRLAADYDLKPTETRWLTAWNLEQTEVPVPEVKPAAEDPLKQFFKLFE